MGIRLLLAIASGALFALALPPHNVEIMGWVAFVPLLWAIAAEPRGKNGEPARPLRTLHAFGLGMLTGLSAGVAQIGWHSNQSALTFAYVPYIWIALVVGGVAALANEAGKASWMKTRGRWVLFVACAGVGMEWLTTLSPLPVSIALCQHRNAPLLQVCAFTGIWGMAFLLWLVNAALADALLRGRRWFCPPLCAALLLLTFAWGGGAVLLDGATGGEKKTVRVAAVQDFSGVDAHDFAPADRLTGDLPDSAALTREAARNGARLIVGTENALGLAFTPENPKTETAELARETGAYLVVGYEASAEPKPFNCAALVGPDGKTVGVHHKLRLFLGEKQTMQPGNAIQTWDTAIGKVGLLICFDTCYTGDVREAVQKGAQIIAVPNYDPPTPGDSLHNLHSAILPFRAVENNVAIVKADPNGKSQIIDAQGRTRAVSPMFRPVALVAPIIRGSGQGTFFTRWGDWLAYLCVALVVAALGVLMFPRAEKPAPAA